MEGRVESEPKRQKIEESSSVSFWKWYLPHSAHPKSAASERGVTFFRFDAAYRIYCKLVRRKWHNRWYLIEILKLSPHQMFTFEVLRAQGAFKTKIEPFVRVVEFWEQ